MDEVTALLRNRWNFSKCTVMFHRESLQELLQIKLLSLTTFRWFRKKKKKENDKEEVTLPRRNASTSPYIKLGCNRTTCPWILHMPSWSLFTSLPLLTRQLQDSASQCYLVFYFHVLYSNFFFFLKN